MQYTEEKIKGMSDGEITQRLANAIGLRHSAYDNGEVSRITGSGPETAYIPWKPLSDWSVTGPLMVEYGVCLRFHQNNGLPTAESVTLHRIGHFGSLATARNENPLRAICEVILMLKLKEN